jgi:predicted hydrolase (HD superfamily)
VLLAVVRVRGDATLRPPVKREDIVNGATDLGVELEEHIAFCIEALKGIADRLGLDGSTAKSA